MALPLLPTALGFALDAGVLWLALCWFAFQCAVTVGATVLALLGGRLARPSTRSPYTYTASGSSPVQSASPKRVPLGCGPDRDRAWHLWSSSSRSVAPRPRSRSPRRLSRRLHGVTRRNASSAEYRLLALRRVPPRIRRTEPSRVAQLATRHAVPLPHSMLNPFQPNQQALTDTHRETADQTLSDPNRLRDTSPY